MLNRLQRRGLRALRSMPTPVRERLVRAGSPGYTLGTVCWIEHHGQVLVVATEYRAGWGLPGGLVDRHELPHDGARREVREEVGLEVDLIGSPVVIVDSKTRTVDFLYRASLASGVSPAIARATSVEISAVEWLASDEAARRVRGTSAYLASKLRFYDSHPSGGLVYLDRHGRALDSPV